MAVEERVPAVAAGWTERSIQICGGEISYLQAGAGSPVLVLPRDNGHAPRNEFLDLLAEGFTVTYPWLPGYHHGHPEQWDWLADVRDLAVVMQQFVETVAPEGLSVVGLGFGGWVAAEMATMSSKDIDRLVLVAPIGIQPREGYIYDQFIGSTEAYARAAFTNQARFDALYGLQPEFDQLEGWETDREMTSRLAWKPYMYNRSLPRLLAGVQAPALVVWGDNDAVVPDECARLYQEALPNATLEVVGDAGHAVDLEQPATLARLVSSFCRPQSA